MDFYINPPEDLQEDRTGSQLARHCVLFKSNTWRTKETQASLTPVHIHTWGDEGLLHSNPTLGWARTTVKLESRGMEQVPCSLQRTQEATAWWAGILVRGTEKGPIRQANEAGSRCRFASS